MKDTLINIKDFVTNYDNLIHFGIGLIIFLILFIFRNNLARLVLNIFSKICFRKSEDKQQSLKDSLFKPTKNLFTITGLFLGIYICYESQSLLKLYKICLILIVCWALVNYLSDNLFLMLHFDDSNNSINTTAITFISNILKILVICFAVVMVISELGYNINGLLTGLGVGGLAVSLAAQDAISNLISGFIIVFDKPFTVGEFIQTTSVQGVVEEVTMRSTKIRTLEDSVITVPNKSLTDDAIVNISRMDKRLIDITINLTYSTSNELLKKCQDDIKQYLVDNQEILESPLRVNFSSLNSSSVDITIGCYTTVTELAQYLRVYNDVNYALKEIVENNGAEFAFPSTSLYIEKQ